MIRRTARTLLLAASPLPLIGCDGPPPMGKVSGVVTLDGKPLPDVEVQFLPDPEQGTRGATANCYTDGQGRFALRTERHGSDGAMVGKHRVVFVDIAALPDPGNTPGAVDPADKAAAPDGKAAAPPAEKRPKKNRVPTAYTDPTKTPFRSVEVKDGDQTLTFDIQTARR